MPIDNSVYPFDPTGSLASNKIVGEQHIITPVNYRDYNFIVPKLAPYFATNIQLSYKNINGQTVPLVENVDYYFTHWFISASRACSKPIYGSITLLNNTLSGVLTLNYQTLGGDWNIDEQLIAQILADTLHNPRRTSWDSVSEMPYAFPVIDHAWDLVDMVGMSDVVDALEDIKNAIITGGDNSFQAHIDDRNNPHGVTAEQVNAFTKQQSDARYLGITDSANDSNKLEGKTLSEVKEEVLTGTAADSKKFDGKTYQDFIDDLSNIQVGNAAKLENRTFDQVKTEILEGKIADSTRFDGLTIDDFNEHIEDAALDTLKSIKRVFPVYISDDENSVDSWTLLITFKMTPVNTPDLLESSVHLILNAAGYITDTYDGSYDIKIDTRGTTPYLSIIQNNAPKTEIGFGLTFDVSTNVYSLWVKTKSARPEMNLLCIGSGNINSLTDEDSVTDTEPANISYTIDRFSEGYVSKEAFVDFINSLTTQFNTLANN